MSVDERVCRGCGADMDLDDKVCPFCGRPALEKTSTRPLRRDKGTFVARQTEDGSTHIQFGDGVTGRRPRSGSGAVRASYRRGVGSQGNVATCPHCHQEQSQSRDTCERCGAKLE